MRRLFGLVLISFVGLAACKSAPGVLITGGKIFGHPGADAIFIAGDRIEAIGSSAELRERAAADSTIIDAQSGHVLPGFHDAHIHMLSGGFALEQIDLSELKTLAEVLDALRKYAAEHPSEPWIRGRGWQYGIVAEGKFPTAADLDTAVADRPVYLESYDGHAGWANSRALAAANVGAETKDPADGKIVRGPDQRTPEGVLLEGATALVEKHIPEATRAQKRAALERAIAHCLAAGITSAEDITGDLETIEVYGDLEREGKLPIRISVSFPLDGDLAKYRALRNRYRSPFLRVGFLKGFVDGVVESKTAFMLAPYEKSETRGEPLIPPDRLHALVRAAHDAGFRVGLHSIGDAAVRLSLDTYERVQNESPSPVLRHRIEHIEVIDPSDLPRFAALGVIASMQPFHANPFGDTPDSGPWSENLGAARLEHSFAWRELDQNGATLAFGSDWPVMTADPLEGLAVAVTRRDRQGLPRDGWNAEQAISIERAISAYSHGSALAIGRDHELGRITPGALADLVILAPDVDLAKPETLWSSESGERKRIAQVIVGGRPRR